jgi:hypothetical protein
VLEGALRGGETAAREGRQRPASEQGTGAAVAVVVLVVVVGIAAGGFMCCKDARFLFFQIYNFVTIFVFVFVLQKPTSSLSGSVLGCTALLNSDSLTSSSCSCSTVQIPIFSTRFAVLYVFVCIHMVSKFRLAAS